MPKVKGKVEKLDPTEPQNFEEFTQAMVRDLHDKLILNVDSMAAILSTLVEKGKNKMTCQCYKIGGPFIAEDPNCPVHGIEAVREREVQNVLIAKYEEKIRELISMVKQCTQQIDDRDQIIRDYEKHVLSLINMVNELRKKIENDINHIH